MATGRRGKRSSCGEASTSPTEVDSETEGDPYLNMCNRFTEVTGTNNAVAMLYLQDRNWSLQRAVNDFTSEMAHQSNRETGAAVSGPSSTSSPPPPSSKRRQTKKRRLSDVAGSRIDGAAVTIIDLTHLPSSSASSSDVEEVTASTAAGARRLFTVLSWNIDGLDKATVRVRTEAVIQSIRHERFHVVCLQEVVQESLSLLQTGLGETYHIFSASDDPIANCFSYFVSLLVLKCPSIEVDRPSLRVQPFPGSQMGRHLVSVELRLVPARGWPSLVPSSAGALATGSLQESPLANEWPVRVRIMTTHLESCMDGSLERKAQLRYCWQAMKAVATASLVQPPGATATGVPPRSLRYPSADHHRCSILCGDLNLRDSEVQRLGGLPRGLLDVWEATGARSELRSTWDPVRNSNASRLFAGCRPPSAARPPPVHRYDRMYLTCETAAPLRPVDFGLRGLERLARSSLFPSDHWAILGQFLF